MYFTFLFINIIFMLNIIILKSQNVFVFSLKLFRRLKVYIFSFTFSCVFCGSEKLRTRQSTIAVKISQVSLVSQ